MNTNIKKHRIITSFMFIIGILLLPINISAAKGDEHNSVTVYADFSDQDAIDKLVQKTFSENASIKEVIVKEKSSLLRYIPGAGWHTNKTQRYFDAFNAVSGELTCYFDPTFNLTSSCRSTVTTVGSKVQFVSKKIVNSTSINAYLNYVVRLTGTWSGILVPGTISTNLPLFN